MYNKFCDPKSFPATFFCNFGNAPAYCLPKFLVAFDCGCMKALLRDWRGLRGCFTRWGRLCQGCASPEKRFEEPEKIQ
jgi:hypothetical protein